MARHVFIILFKVFQTNVQRFPDAAGMEWREIWVDEKISPFIFSITGFVIFPPIYSGK
jgi:hypothetical protein